MPSSAQHQIALEFCQAFASLDADAHVALRSPDCVQVFAPASVGINTPKDNQAFASHINGLRKIMAGFPVNPKEIFSDHQSGHVTVWAESEARFHDEVKDSEHDWHFRGEYIFVLQLDERGEKITRIIEFLDSKKTEQLQTLAAKARQNLANRGS